MGVVFAALGLISLLTPMMSVGFQTQSRQTISPVISTVMILGGVGLMIAGKSGI
jgi:hypothetical protein